MKNENPRLGGIQARAVEKTIIQQNDIIGPSSKFQPRADEAIGLTFLPSPNFTPLEAALEYARQGIPVFPLHGIRNGRCTCGTFCGEAAGKHPLIAGGFRAARTNLPQIRKWWRKWPTANIGIPTGAASGIAVIETSSPEGLTALQALFAQHGALLENATTAVKTQHGYQFYFLIPRGFRLISRSLPDGLVAYADGAFVVAPPSVVPLSRASNHAFGRC